MFYGEQAGMAGPLPHAINTSTLPNKVVPGAVVVAECCYGAELFAPILPHQPLGMAYSYLEHGAATFLGSTTISYGGALAKDLTCADDLCLFFLERLLLGDSCGEALRHARNSILIGQKQIGNHEIKTLAQFILLGDPSRKPVKVTKGMASQKAASAVFSKATSEIGPSFSSTIPLRKAGAPSVANKAFEGDPAKRLPSVPLPGGQMIEATFYTSEKTKATKKSIRLMTKAARNASMQTTEDDASSQSGILEVYVPNDPALIAAMRDAWDLAQHQTHSAKPLILSKAVQGSRVFEASGALQMTSLESATPPPTFPRVLEDDRLGAVTKLPPSHTGPHPSATQVGPERNRQAALVARIVNGQIESYKVVVAR
jgi:hypothetical protein